MVMRTRIPNPYWNAQALARLYREQLMKLTKLAAEHRKIAESLQSGADQLNNQELLHDSAIERISPIARSTSSSDV
jgi:hypothetical protein